MRVHHLKKFFPILLFAGVLQSAFADLLPYSSARVDIFMKGSNIHNIQKEFAVLSLDGSIRAIGRVSTGRGGATGARRWQIIGVEYYKTSNKFNDAPMPKAMNLSHYGVLSGSNIFFHGSSSYGEFDGEAHSHGCIRLMTVNDADKNIWEDPGLNQSFWKFLNAGNLKQGYLDWDGTSAAVKEYVGEMRRKITVYTHNENSLRRKPGWKESFERLYDDGLINKAIDRTEGSGKSRRLLGFQEFNERLNNNQLGILAQIEE